MLTLFQLSRDDRVLTLRSVRPDRSDTSLCVNLTTPRPRPFRANTRTKLGGNPSRREEMVFTKRGGWCRRYGATGAAHTRTYASLP